MEGRFVNRPVSFLDVNGKRGGEGSPACVSQRCARRLERPREQPEKGSVR
jgi:hypothetical protein